MRTTPLSWILEQLSPSLCLACDRELPENTAFCGGCVATIERSGTPCSPFLYGGAIAQALSKLKYNGRRDLGPVLGRLLVLGIGDALSGPVDIVAPVPLHREKLIARGYNQSVWLSRSVARALNAPHDALLLKRIRETPPQAHLGVREREANMMGSFVVRSAQAVAGRSVMIVDDVRTTGATLGACTAALREAGATKVTTLSLCVTARVN